MLIIPAIDIMDGCVVRLIQGKFDKKIYSRDPIRTAKHWVKSGASILHIIDLDGAVTGKQKNLNIVKEIIRAIKVPIQFGGGIRKIETIKTLLGLGVWRVIIGTRAVVDSAFLKKAFSGFKDRVIVSVDVKDKRILIKGWQSYDRGKDVLVFARFLKSTGFKQMIYTDTLKDGTLSGANIKGIKGLLKDTGLNIIASGGICSLDDIYKLKKLQKQGLVGVIIGKALYEGKFTLQQALKFS